MKKPFIVALMALLMGALAMPVVGAEQSTQTIQQMSTQANSNPLAKQGYQLAYIYRVGPRGRVYRTYYYPRYYYRPYYYRNYYYRPYHYWYGW